MPAGACAISPREPATGVFTYQEARAFYDRFGAKQDLQRIYEDPAIAVLEAHAEFERAAAVVEFGCGTGRLARELLERRLTVKATYVGVDVSQTMVDLARERLRPWSERARVVLTDGSIAIPAPDASCDRFLCAYVLDLLSPADARTLLDEARRVLAPDGRICLASLTFGRASFARAVSRLWSWIQARRPSLVGGCRPIRLLECVGDGWRVVHHQTVCTLGLCTEVLVACPDPDTAHPATR